VIHIDLGQRLLEMTPVMARGEVLINRPQQLGVTFLDEFPEITVFRGDLVM
jgi:hypothetical protein